MPDIFEVMSTMRAMRRLKPDPVPDELINKILQAGQWAPSGGNTQRWRFLVVKDPEIKKQVQVYYKRLFDESVGLWLGMASSCFPKMSSSPGYVPAIRVGGRDKPVHDEKSVAGELSGAPARRTSAACQLGTRPPSTL